jgi:hypothetical protein
MRDEGGQILPFMLIGLLAMLLGLAGLVIDVGQSYWAKRQLQSATDAAALAAAQELPGAADTSLATSLAAQYGVAGFNTIHGVTSPQQQVTATCLNRTPGCASPNAVVVTATAEVKTTFSKLFGFDSFTISATSKACSPCGSKPLDVMFLIDRTGSMCQDHFGTPDPACTDLANARAGMKSFLQLMDPRLDHVGLAVLPPAWSTTDHCDPPQTLAYAYPWPVYTIVPLSSDYLNANGTLNTGSQLVQQIDCIKGGGSTAYAQALEFAQQELVADGRPGTQRVIVFMSDGAANDGPFYYGQTSPYLTQPCHQGVASAATIKAAGTIVYSIGYDVNPIDDGKERCKNAIPDKKGNVFDEDPQITAYEALNGIASPGDFYLGNDLTAAQMRSIFSSVASDILRGSSRLVSDNA